MIFLTHVYSFYPWTSLPLPKSFPEDGSVAWTSEVVQPCTNHWHQGASNDHIGTHYAKHTKVKVSDPVCKQTESGSHQTAHTVWINELFIVHHLQSTTVPITYLAEGIGFNFYKHKIRNMRFVLSLHKGERAFAQTGVCVRTNEACVVWTKVLCVC